MILIFPPHFQKKTLYLPPAGWRSRLSRLTHYQKAAGSSPAPATITMAYTIEQYNKLKAAIATGALEVKYADKTVKYRSLDEMTAILTAMGKELGLISSGKTHKYPSFSKGL